MMNSHDVSNLPASASHDLVTGTMPTGLQSMPSGTFYHHHPKIAYLEPYGEDVTFAGSFPKDDVSRPQICVARARLAARRRPRVNTAALSIAWYPMPRSLNEARSWSMHRRALTESTNMNGQHDHVVRGESLTVDDSTNMIRHQQPEQQCSYQGRASLLTGFPVPPSVTPW